MKRGKVPGIILWLIIITPATVNLFRGAWDAQQDFFLANVLGFACYAVCRTVGRVLKGRND